MYFKIQSAHSAVKTFKCSAHAINPSLSTLLLTAPTGDAAVNVSGTMVNTDKLILRVMN